MAWGSAHCVSPTLNGAPKSLDEMEKSHILRVLETCNWNQSRTARILGVHRNTLIARLAAWGIRPPSRGIVRQGMVGEPPQGRPPAEGELA